METKKRRAVKKPAIKILPSVERTLPKAFQQEVDRLVRFALGQWVGVEILRQNEDRDTDLAPMISVSQAALLNPDGQIVRKIPLSRTIQLWQGDTLDIHLYFRTE